MLKILRVKTIRCHTHQQHAKHITEERQSDVIRTNNMLKILRVKTIRCHTHQQHAKDITEERQSDVIRTNNMLKILRVKTIRCHTHQQHAKHITEERQSDVIRTNNMLSYQSALFRKEGEQYFTSMSQILTSKHPNYNFSLQVFFSVQYYCTLQC